MKGGAGIALGLLASVSLVLPAFAGSFKITDVFSVEQVSTDGSTTRAMIGATAFYEGEVDPNDDYWAMQTNLYNALMKTEGSPLSGAGVPASRTISLDPRQHGAFKDIENCTPSGGGNQYQGEGVIGIYRQYNPEIDQKYGPWTSTTCTDPVSEPGSGGEDGGTEPVDPNPGSCETETCSPILIDLDRGGFRLTAAGQGVLFDLDRDGDLEGLAWTESGGGDAWLALDRNSNGRIDDGGELFGNFTDQPARDEPHGFHALAVFDIDGDRQITAADPVFSALRLWTDRNRDGISQPAELMDMATARLEWIGLDVVESRSRDRHGNELRYRGQVGRDGSRTVSTDVFLTSTP